MEDAHTDTLRCPYGFAEYCNTVSLNHELRHRLKNIFTTVEAIADQTFRSSSTLADAQQKITNRIQAVSRFHDALCLDDYKNTSLISIMSAILDSYFCDGRGRIMMSCGPILLAPNAGLGIAMTLNELATNSHKYGALSVNSGMVEIQIDAYGDFRHLKISWKESGGPKVVPPERTGFGLTMIEFVFQRQLNGELFVDFQEHGLELTVILPIDKIGQALRSSDLAGC